MSVLSFTISGQPGGILITTVHAILPDIHAKNKSVIYCDVFPEGIGVDQPSDELCSMWWAMIGEWMLEEDDDDEAEV